MGDPPMTRHIAQSSSSSSNNNNNNNFMTFFQNYLAQPIPEMIKRLNHIISTVPFPKHPWLARTGNDQEPRSRSLIITVSSLSSLISPVGLLYLLQPKVSHFFKLLIPVSTISFQVLFSQLHKLTCPVFSYSPLRI